MLAAQRRKFILQQLNNHGIVNVTDTSKELNIHETTIRRDLEKLEKEGKLTRIYGGATLTDDSVELTMTQKKDLHYDAKKSVCEYASQFVKEGDCVFIDGGTTTAVLIDYLQHKKITIITHSSLVIQKIKNCEAQIITIGGKYLPHYKMSVGINAINEVKKYQYDHCFVGCVGVNIQAKMCYTSEEETLAVKQSAMENSTHTYLLMDASKVNVKGFCKFASTDTFEKIICNSTQETITLPNIYYTNTN